MSNKYSFLAVSTVICALALSSQSVSAQTTVFDDTFNNGSTINQAPVAPTANSASYEYAASQLGGTTSTTIAPGDMNIEFNNTSSMFGEIEAQFTSSPLTLATVGDSIDLTVTFVNTERVLTAGDAGSRLAIGLYNSGGVAPLQGQMLLNGGPYATGGAKNWQGFLGQATTAGTSEYIGVRNPQTAANASVQDLLFNNATANVAFGSPLASILATSAATTTIATGSTNTFEIMITLTGASSMDISNTLYAGAGTGGTVLYSLNGTTNGVINNFDALAFGWRFSGTKTNSTGDIQEIKVTDDIAAVPEPSSIMLAVAGFGLMLGLIRRRRS
jgi:hypothetical protein